VATDFRLWLMRACDTIHQLLTDLCLALLENAEPSIDVVMPGYTHLQHAQPVSWGHWLLSHLWPLIRDRNRFETARASAAVLPLGSGALAGTAFPIDRNTLAKDLGFSSISHNSIDAVSDRDFALEFLFAGSVLAIHLSRLSEALILFNSAEFGFVTIDEAYVTGSSLMPQKKNPDPLELTRGKAGRMIGQLVGLMTTLKGLPSAYDKDLQEDKEPVFDAFDTLILILPVLTGIISTLEIHPDRMAAQLEVNLLATDLVDELVQKGIPFREAHRWVSKMIHVAESKNLSISELTNKDLRTINPDFVIDLEAILDYEASLAKKIAIGGTSKSAILHQMEEARKAIG
jgi:argininosuccinate lyase